MNTESEHDRPPNSMWFEDAIELGLHLLKRTLLRWPVFVAVVPISIATFFLVPRVIRPIYESSAVLLYRDVIHTDMALGLNAIQTESGRARDNRLREMVLSRATLIPIITSNGLYRDVVERRGEIEAIGEMRQAIRCQVTESGAITIGFRGESPQQAVKVVKDLIASMTLQARKYGVEQSQSTVTFLETQVATSHNELSNAEQRLAEFLSVHPEFALDLAAQSTQIGTGIRADARGQNANQIADPLAALQRQLDIERLQNRVQEASRQQALAVVPSSTSDTSNSAATVAEAERDLEQAQKILTDRLSQFTEKHPDVVAARTQVQQKTQRLAEVRQSNLGQPPSRNASTPNGTDAAETTDVAALDVLKAELNQLQRMPLPTPSARTGPHRQAKASKSARSERSGVVATETEWSSLIRDAVSARERNEQLQRQLFRASLLAKVQTNGGGQIIVIDEAYEPRRPVTRGKNRTGAAGAALVMFLGLLTAFALALLDDRLYEQSDVRRHGIGPIAHVVPVADLRVREM